MDYLILILLLVVIVILFWLGRSYATTSITEQRQEKILKSNMNDYLIAHESGTKDYYLYLSNGEKMSSYKFDKEEIVKLYNAIKKTLELEKLI